MKKYLHIILYSFLLTILSARVDDATCYNYAIIENSFYLYADGYIGGIQMTLTHDNNFALTLAGDSFLDGYNTAGNQTAVGRLALKSNTTGYENTAVGALALEDNTTGGSCVAVGVNALSSNTTATENTAVGHQALYLNTTGYHNTA